MPTTRAKGRIPSETGRDGRLIMAARALRTFGYGCTSVLLAELLTQDGDAPWQSGLLLAVASAGSVVASLTLGLFADAWGRRRALAACGCLMAVSGARTARLPRPRAESSTGGQAGRRPNGSAICVSASSVSSRSVRVSCSAHHHCVATRRATRNAAVSISGLTSLCCSRPATA